MNILLSNISNHQKVIVSSIQEGELRLKLIEMGIVEGKTIQILYKAPFGGPLGIEVGQTVLSLRKDEADVIYVTMKNSDS